MTTSSAVSVRGGSFLPAPRNDAPEGTLLGKYIVQRLSDHKALQDSRRRKIVRKGLEATAMVIVIGARVAMTQICLSGSAEILDGKVTDTGPLVMGVINATGAIIAFGCLSAFTKLKIIEALTRYIPPNEQELMSDDIGPYTMTAIKTVSVILGFSSQIPWAIGAYDSALFAPMLNGVFTFLDGGRSSWSIYNTITSALQFRRKPKTETAGQLVIAKKNILKKIDTYRALLASEEFSASTKNASINTSIENIGTIDDSITIDMILNNDKAPQNPRPLPRSVTWVLNASILLMAAATFAEFYKLGEDGAKDMTANTAVQASLASFCVFASLHLWMNLIAKTTYATADFVRGANSVSLTKKVSPKFYDRFTKWGTWISVPTFVPTVYFAKLYFPKMFFYPVATLSSAAGFLGGLSALHGLRDIIVLRRNASDPTIVLDKRLAQIRETISKTNLSHIAAFLAALPDDIRDKLQSPSPDELAQYICETKKQPTDETYLLDE
jgi:hypothetical protein